MPRRYRPAKRVPAPDPVYNDGEVSKFINRMMIRGKKSISEKILYRSLEILAERQKGNPLELFQQVLRKAKPMVRVKARRVGGSTYQVPMEVNEEEGIAIGSRWIIANARNRSGKAMAMRLADEFSDILAGTGATLKKREETHRMAEANRAFAHYRF